MQCKQRSIFSFGFCLVSIISSTGRSQAENGLACIYLEISAGICMDCALVSGRSRNEDNPNKRNGF
jgi:hypothetical protein